MRTGHALEGIPARLRHLIALADHRLLMLDYDGTLAPFAVERERARPEPRTLELLRLLAGSTHTTVAIVSGRPLRELQALIGALPVALVGEHGWESRTADGRVVERALDPAVDARLDEAERRAHAAADGAPLERKRASLVLHTRGLSVAQASDLARRCAEAWEPLLAGRALRLDEIDGGLELRARERDKGTVVASLVAESPPGSLAVFVGDDVTDEDAFDVVRQWGFGIRVGDPDRDSLAWGDLASVEAVPAFLEEWLRLATAR